MWSRLWWKSFSDLNCHLYIFYFVSKKYTIRIKSTYNTQKTKKKKKKKLYPRSIFRLREYSKSFKFAHSYQNRGFQNCQQIQYGLRWKWEFSLSSSSHPKIETVIYPWSHSKCDFSNVLPTIRIVRNFKPSLLLKSKKKEEIPSSLCEILTDTLFGPYQTHQKYCPFHYCIRVTFLYKGKREERTNMVNWKTLLPLRQQTLIPSNKICRLHQ